MKLSRAIASIATAVALTTGGLAATAAPAAAAPPCPAGKLCLWEDTDFVDLDVTSTSTNACIKLWNYGESGFFFGIGSYVNNLSVNANVYHYSPAFGFVLDGTIRPGGASSNTGSGSFGDDGMVCMGSATPWS